MKFEDVKKAHEEYKNKVIKRVTIFASIAVVIAFIAACSNSGTASSFLMSFLFSFFGIAIFLSILCLIIVYFTTQKEAKNYRSLYKAYFVKANLEKIFTDLKYDHNLGIARSFLTATQMINTGDVYSSNDYVSGKYKDVAFTQADVHIQVESTDSDGNTTYVTIFRGRMMVFEFPKKFNFRLEVAEKGFGANRIPSKDKKTGRKFRKIDLESSEFNKIFKTYAEDGFEAFYLLDPAFIDNILKLDSEYKGKILLGFFDNKLLVGLKDGKDAFEPPSVFKKLDEKTETEKITRETRLITDFVDKLKLNNKLFK